MGKMMPVSPSDDAKRFLREMLPVVLTGWAGILVFHRATLLSGFDIVQADIGDSRLVVFLLEHWSQVLAGNAGWASPSMFYPVKGVLGYSDMMFGTGVLYTLFRNFGLGLFQATNATMVLLSLLAYLSAYWVLRRVLKATLLGSIVGAFFFSFAYPKFAQLGHLQLRFDFFQPLALAAIAPLLLEERAMCRRELATRTSIFAGLVCLAASTAFYNAWFFVFFLALSTLVAASYRAIRTRIVMRLREARRVLWLPILLCAVMLAPFLIVYLPALRLGERSWKNTIEYLPRLSSYFWLGPEHFLWGSLRFNSSDGIAYAIENHLGFGVAVTSVVFVGWAWAIRHFVRAIRGRNQALAPGSDVLSAMLVSSLIVTAITVRWGSFSPWKAVYELVPGASVLVGVGRWVLTLTLPVSILIAVGAGWLQQRMQGRHALSRAILLAAGSFIAVEQVGRIPAVYSAAVASWYHEEVAHVIPASCEGFLLVPPVQSDNAPLITRENFDEANYLAANPDVAQNWPGSAWDHYTQLGHREGRLLDLDAAAVRRFHNFHYHLSAMIAAAISGKPTVNGASGLGPAGYPVSNLYQQDIVQKLDAWMSGYPSRGACLISKEFSPYKLAAPGPRSRFLGITLMD